MKNGVLRKRVEKSSKGYTAVSTYDKYGNITKIVHTASDGTITTSVHKNKYSGGYLTQVKFYNGKTYTGKAVYKYTSKKYSVN